MIDTDLLAAETTLGSADHPWTYQIHSWQAVFCMLKQLVLDLEPCAANLFVVEALLLSNCDFQIQHQENIANATAAKSSIPNFTVEAAPFFPGTSAATK